LVAFDEPPATPCRAIGKPSTRHRELFEFTPTRTSKTRVEIYTDEEMAKILDTTRTSGMRDYRVTLLCSRMPRRAPRMI
ncbi:MAG: hypothetical protein GYA24_18165, partial [Candidatus Lokiarchaeota archaeon]|nr:hypothetical protein [Candidatus Lokiarchaeota archaeon]